MSRHIIAGIDPGTTIGIAILDLSGRKIATLSASNGMGEAVSIIEKHGTPSLIACDKMPAPEMVHKVASYFSCRPSESSYISSSVTNDISMSN